jgi:hypothetical protein
MAKPDLFRILGCVVLVTLTLVIAVKMSKQCMKIPPSISSTPHANSGSTRSLSATPGTQAHSECQSGFRPDQNGFCIRDY